MTKKSSAIAAMRAPLLAAWLSACASTQNAQTSPNDFSGAWSVEQCDKRQPERECAVFILYLVHDGERICGEHVVATSGLARLDEGDPGGVRGTTVDGKAVLLIRSTRNGADYLARAELVRGGLEWHLIGMATEAGNDISPIIPTSEYLTRNDRKDHLQHLEEVRSAPCLWPDGHHSKDGGATAGK